MSPAANLNGREAPLRALIVDDTPDIRMLLRVALETLGEFDIVGEASDGAEGVRLATALQPDVVLLDLAMPVMDGLQATPEILRGTPATKIVILSGFSKDRMEQEARAMGAHAYLEKGTSPTDIVDLVRAVCASGPEPTEPTPIDAATGPTEAADNSVHDTAEELDDGDGNWQRRIAMALGHAMDLAGAFTTFGKIVRERIRFDRGGFAVAQPNGFSLAAVCGPEDGRIPVGTVVPVDGEHAAALRKGRPFHIVDTAATSGTAGEYFVERGIRSYATVPIMAAGNAQALVGFASLRPREFSPDDLTLLEAVVRQAAAPLYYLYCLARKQETTDEREAADELRLEWNRIMRHDLRSPLTVINGFANMMQSAWDELPEPKKREFVQAIVRGTTTMSKLLSDMEQVDHIESVGPDAVGKPIDLATIIEQTLTDMVASSGRAVVVGVEDDLPMALGDECSQRRVLSNLLENALKFSPDDSKVEVAVTEAGGMIHVRVRDFGVGMSAGDQEKLFRKFSRPTQQSGKSKVPGSGLGLYICRSLVEAQGGRIWVESAPGEGSSFTYTVPVAATSELRDTA